MVGVVKEVKKEGGFAFVVGSDGVDRFVHYTNLLGITIEQLTSGLDVEFEPVTSARGPRAVSVRLYNNGRCSPGGQSKSDDS